MRLLRKHILHNRKAECLIYFIPLIFVFSCSVTKHIPKDKYLLNKTKIITDNKVVEIKEMNGYVRQKPNKKIFGIFRFRLGLYNLSKTGTSPGINKWFRQIGEEPVIFDEFSLNKTKTELHTYLENKGFFNATVRDSVFFKKKKAEVYYIADMHDPCLIRSLNYIVRDDDPNQDLWELIYKDSINSIIIPGSYYNLKNFENERKRIEILAKNNGYYKFSREYVYFSVDTNNLDNKMDVNQKIYDNISPDSLNTGKHPVFYVNDISFDILIDSKSTRSLQNDTLPSDTLNINGIKFFYKEKLKIKPEVLIQANNIKKGLLYSLNDREQTYKSLSSLGIFKTINIIYRENNNGGNNSPGHKTIDCIIQVTPYETQFYDVALEGTHSNGNMGVAGNLLYKHRNLFRGAESFDLKFKGAVEFINDNVKNLDKITEYGFEARLNFPKFFLPVRMENFYKRYNPKTSFSFIYNYQKRPDYTRLITNLNFGYFWNGSKYLSHTINPVEFNSVNVKDISENFSNIIRGTYIENSYKTHLVTVSKYSLLYNNQSINKNNDFMFLRFNLESGGNLLTGVNKLAGSKQVNDSYRLLGTQYAQFFKADVEFRKYWLLNTSNTIVYRTFFGAGLPYGNMNVLPFEKKFYSGGSYGIRAWQVRSLGPGSYTMDESAGKVFYPNQLGDIKIEFNLEYRFDLFWVLEGAVFFDAGNIWAINSADDRSGALFEWNDFYREIALGTGLGARLDFQFFLLRLDLGYKLRDPGLPLSNRWIPINNSFNWDNLMLNLGIGYPF